MDQWKTQNGGIIDSDQGWLLELNPTLTLTAPQFSTTNLIVGVSNMHKRWSFVATSHRISHYEDMVSAWEP